MDLCPETSWSSSPASSSCHTALVTQVVETTALDTGILGRAVPGAVGIHRDGACQRLGCIQAVRTIRCVLQTVRQCFLL
jgi:hypothetical protein